MLVPSSQVWLIPLVETVLVQVHSCGVFVMGNTWVYSTAIRNPKNQSIC